MKGIASNAFFYLDTEPL